MALKSELMTYLGYKSGTKGMKFVRSSNTIFMASTAVKEGVDVLEVPKIGHPVTTEEVSVKQGNNRNG